MAPGLILSFCVILFAWFLKWQLLLPRFLLFVAPDFPPKGVFKGRETWCFLSPSVLKEHAAFYLAKCGILYYLTKEAKVSAGANF